MPPDSHASLLLVGAGHPHLHLIAHARRLSDAGYAVTLLAPAEFRYSGVASARAVGALSARHGRIDVSRLAPGRSINHVVGRLVDLDLAKHQAVTDSGSVLHWDVVSFNVGSVASHAGIDHVDPGVIRIKPLEDLDALTARLAQAADTARTERRRALVTIIGAGSSGLELAGHVSRQRGVQVRLIEAGSSLVPQLPDSARARIYRLLATRGVVVATDSPVRRIETDRVYLRDGQALPHDVAVLATGLHADPLVTRIGQNADGIPVSATLQHVNNDAVYAVGDCAHFTPSPLPKVGVHGVRQGPVLLDSLIRRAAGAPLPSFRPQPHPLQILDLGGGVGLATRGQRWWCGRSALLAKRWIDRRWLAQYESR